MKVVVVFVSDERDRCHDAEDVALKRETALWQLTPDDGGLTAH